MSTAANWAGYFKRQYGGIVTPIPEANTFRRDFAFIPKAKRPGDTYEVNVKLGKEHGVTHDDTRTAYTYQSSADSIELPARLRGSSISLVGKIPRDVIEQLESAMQRNAPVSGLDEKIAATLEGTELYTELMLHYGPGPASTALSSIGTVSTIVSGTNLGAGGPIVCDLTRATWAGGMWNQFAGGTAMVDVVESDLSTVVETDVVVQAVSHDNNRLTLAKSGAATDVDATDVLMARNAIDKSAVGLHGILSNTGSLFELSAATYPQWKAETFAAGGALVRSEILALGSRLSRNGLKSGGKLYLNSAAIADLGDELSDLQTFDSPDGRTSKTKEFGATVLRYHTPCGTIEAVEDNFMQQGIGMFVGRGNGTKKLVVDRVGARDVTIEQPGGEIVQNLEGSAGSQVVGYTNQAPFANIPYHCALITGITSSGDTSPSA